MIDKDFEKYMEKKRKCKGYSNRDKIGIYKYYTTIKHGGVLKTFPFLNAEDAKWAYLKFHEILYKESFEKAVSWMSNYNQEYRKDYVKKCLDSLECEWRYVNGSNEKYAITEYGEVYNLHGKKLNPGVTKHGYKLFAINIGGKITSINSHRLVADAFLEKPNKENLVIDHIDRDKLNNHYSNLRWVSIRENNINTDLIDNAKGYRKIGNIYEVRIKFAKKVFTKRFSSQKDARNFYLKHRKNLNSLSVDKTKEYIKNLKLEAKKEKLKKTRGYHKNGKKYYSRILHNKKTINLGSFKTEKEARQAYLDGVEKYHGIKIEE